MKRVKVILALIVASTMLFSGCSKANVKTTSEPVKNSEAMAPLGKYTEPITLTVSKTMVAGATLIDGQTPENNVMLDIIREKLNVNYKIAWQVDSKEYNNKLSLNIASGDLPDVMYVTNYLTFRQMQQNNLLADLTEAYNKCAGKYMKDTYASFNGKNMKPLTFDGKLMAISTANLGYGQDILWLRNDWLKKLNLTPPKTVDDLGNILKAFVEKDPGGTGARSNLGLLLNASKPVGSYGNTYGAEPIFYSFGAYPRQWMKDNNGKVYYGSTAPEMKKGLAVLRDWYKNGLIDKQFLTRLGTGETDALVVAGKGGAYFGPWHGIQQETFTNNPNSEWLPVNAPLDQNGKYNYVSASPIGDLLVVNKNCKHPEALINTVNVAYDVIRGIDKEGYDRYMKVKEKGANLYAMTPISTFILDFYNVVPKLGKLTKQYVETGAMGGDELTTDYDRNEAKLAKDFKDGKKDKVTYKAYYRRYLASNILEAPEANPLDAAYYFDTESSVSLKPTLEKLEDQMYLQIIVGEKPLDYFDEFVQQWHKLGGDTLIKEVEQAIK